MTEEPKAKSKSVSLLPELWEKVEAKALEGFSGNRSRYFQQLVENDLAGTSRATPEATGENILVELAERLRPERAAKLKAHLASYLVAQPEMLGKVIEAIADDFRLREEEAAKGNPSILGPCPQVLIKLLPESAHAVQAAYAFRQLPNDAQKLAFMFDPEINRKLALQAAISAALGKPSPP